MCRHQLVELEAYLDAFREQKTEIIAVTSDRRHILEETAVRLDLSFPMLADPDLQMTILYGVLHPIQFLPRPAVFIIDQTGTIRYRYIGRGVHDRPPAEALVDILKHL